MTVHLHTDIKILFIELTDIVMHIGSVLLSSLFGIIISFLRRETWHAVIFLSAMFIMDGDTGNERVTRQGMMGRSQLVEDQGRNPVGLGWS